MAETFVVRVSLMINGFQAQRLLEFDQSRPIFRGPRSFARPTITA